MKLRLVKFESINPPKVEPNQIDLNKGKLGIVVLFSFFVGIAGSYQDTSVVMSRRRGEFEHRTSIFEGAFRAWSHLGGLDAEELEAKSPSELDPLTNPITNDSRLSKSGEITLNPDGSKRREYPYEPLPRSGLAHPYVQAILSPWLGPDADNEAIQLGLTTLRTWWQHRRKGESGSAIAALGTEKMKGVVEGYTRHFFTLAHCLVVNDKVQPPRGLHSRLKELEKLRNKKNKKKGGDGKEFIGFATPNAMNSIRADLTNPNLTPLEQLHRAQQHQLDYSQGICAPMPPAMSGLMNGDVSSQAPIIDMRGQCIPGKIDLPSVVDTVTSNAQRLAHNGGTAGDANPYSSEYGDPNTTPVVFVSKNGDIQIAMNVDGITCSHCIKIVETVLKGCNGNKSPINGLLDAAADRVLKSVLIKIDKASNAKRIAFEAKRNLAMVGYTARAKEMSIVDQGADPKVTMNLGSLSTAFEVISNTDTQDVFDWTIPCTCPDNGVLRGDCKRHSQMNTRIFEAFDKREHEVTEYMAGCGRKFGLDCTCGPGCRCKNCPMHSNPTNGNGSSLINNPSNSQPPNFKGHHMNSEQAMDFSSFGMGPPAPIDRHSIDPVSMGTHHARRPAPAPRNFPHAQLLASANNNDRVIRNPSLLSYGNTGPRNNGRSSIRNSIRGMSITSETTFGRAMSGLSALSIDWENLDDFDLEVDHSAHVNNSSPNGGNQGVRRSSLRRSVMSNGSNEPHVSFKV